MRRKINMSTRDLLSEVKYETGLNSYESALVLERMLLNEESPISSLYSFAGSAMWDTVKVMLAERIIEALGYGDHKEGIIAIGVKRWVMTIEWAQIQKYFGAWDEGGCEMWINSLLDTLVDTIAELIINKIISTFKEEIDPGEPPRTENIKGTLGIDFSSVGDAFSEFTGGLTVDNIKKIAGTFIREQLINSIFPEDLRDHITAKICDAMAEFSLSDVTSSSFSDVTSKLSSMVGLGDENNKVGGLA